MDTKLKHRAALDQIEAKALNWLREQIKKTGVESITQYMKELRQRSHDNEGTWDGVTADLALFGLFYTLYQLEA